jgi:hypothetical protein
MGILWTIIIGFLAGVIAKFILPGDNEPAGFCSHRNSRNRRRFRRDLPWTGAWLVRPRTGSRIDRRRRGRDYRAARLWDDRRASPRPLANPPNFVLRGSSLSLANSSFC